MSRTTTCFLVALVSLVASGAGCRTATGPGVHVTVRAEPKAGYKPPMISPDGEVSGYGATVEPGPSEQAAPVEPGYELIDYRRLGGIVVWVEPIGAGSRNAGARAPTASPPRSMPPKAVVDLRNATAAEMEDVYLTSVGGYLACKVPAATRGQFVLRAAGGGVTDLPPDGESLRLDTAGLIEVVGEYGDVVAQVLVTPEPWARKVRHGEPVTFAPLPPGRYRVTTWHPVLPGSSKVVEVTPGPLVKLTLTVGVNALPKAGK